MIKVEGFKAFRGIMKITPKTDKILPFEVEGDWLYKPDYGCWYCKGSSFMEGICEVVKDYTE